MIKLTQEEFDSLTQAVDNELEALAGDGDPELVEWALSLETAWRKVLKEAEVDND